MISQIYMFKEGLVRFATEKYSTKSMDLRSRRAHLTNYSVNKHSEKYVKATDKALCGIAKDAPASRGITKEAPASRKSSTVGVESATGAEDASEDDDQSK